MRERERQRTGVEIGKVEALETFTGWERKSARGISKTRGER